MTASAQLFLFLLAVLAPNTSQDASITDSAGLRILTVTDLARVQRITDVDVSSDGRLAVYVVRSVTGDVTDRDDEAHYRSHLYLIDLILDNAEPVALTSGERGGSSPAIHPDGSMLAFVRRGEGDLEGEDEPQVWLLALDGPGEARQVTELEEGATNPRWLGDGGRLLVSTSTALDSIDGTPPWAELRPGRDWDVRVAGDEDDADEQAAPSDPDGDLTAMRRWLDAGAAEEDPVTIARLAFQAEQGLRGAEELSRLVIVDTSADEFGRTTVLDTAFHDAGGALPAPDGAWAVFADRADPTEHPDESRRRALWRVDLASGAVTILVDAERASLGSPRFTPDGRALWYTSRNVAEPTFANTLLRLVRLENGSRSTLAAGVDAHARDVTVDPDGAAWFVASRQGRSSLHHVDKTGRGRAYAVVPGESADEPALLGGEVLALDVGGGRVLMAVSSADDPAYLVERTLDDSPRIVARPNATLLDGLVLSEPRVHWLVRPDGVRVQYWVLPALGRAAGERAPVVLSLHGGPHVMWGAGSHTMWHEWQWMAARGYAVVFANPRGSDGYGYEHRKGNYRDWGTGPANDVLACLDEALERYADELDSERLFLTGGSYAGYLTAWIVGHEQRFRAAVAQRGVYDLVTFFGEGNAWRLVEHSFGGMPWEPEVRGILVRESPFTYVEAMRTPLLIMHASRDLRTGVSQSEMLYRALQELDRPVEYVRYPAEGHDLSRTGDPRRRVDRLLRIVEFFERFDPQG